MDASKKLATCSSTVRGVTWKPTTGLIGGIGTMPKNSKKKKDNSERLIDAMDSGKLPSNFEEHTMFWVGFGAAIIAICFAKMFPEPITTKTIDSGMGSKRNRKKALPVAKASTGPSTTR